jgi:membrane associated rhomboid family serine protease
LFIPLYDNNPLRHLSRPYVNYGIIGLTCVVFLMTGGFDQYAVQNAAYGYGLIPALIYNYDAGSVQSVPEFATFITHAFLHADWLHLGGNMLFLWVFGDNIEDAMGPLRYVFFYLACAVLAGLVYSFMSPDSSAPLIGASGAVAGIVGAYLVLHPRVKLFVLLLGRIPLKLSAMWVLGAWALFQLFNVAVATPEDMVAWWAHIGGLAVGALLIVPLRRAGVPLLGGKAPEPS